MTTPIPAPQTIAEMLADLGAPRNYAEQGMMRRMRELAKRQTKAELEAETATDTRRERCLDQADDAWSTALTYKYAIEQFRQWGATPVMEEYDTIADQLDAEHAARLSTEH